MKPEHRDLIDPKLKKKIENLVRKSAGVRRSASPEAEVSSLTACPFCQADVRDMDLSCNGCKNEIPFCIATGHHISRRDLTFCPHCDFPAFVPSLRRLLQSEPVCPMCSNEWRSESVTAASTEYVERYLISRKQAE